MQLRSSKQQPKDQPVWGVFLTLYELLDEFAPHLLKSAWPSVSQLHPAADEFAAEDADTDVACSTALNKLRLQSPPQAPGAGPTEADHGPLDSPPSTGRALPMAFCWTSVLWQLALQHKNLQVQRMALRTLLKRRWTPAVIQQIPASFISGVLLPALLSPVHHKTATNGLGQAGMVAAADDGKQLLGQRTPGLSCAHPVGEGDAAAADFNAVSQASLLLGAYMRSCGGPAARQVLSAGLQLVSSSGQDLPRSGLLACLKVLAAAARAATAAKCMFADLDVQQAGAPGSPPARLGLSDKAWAAAARAEVAAQAAAAAAGLLARVASTGSGLMGGGAQSSSSSPMLRSLLQLQGSLMETANRLTEQQFAEVVPPTEPKQQQAALSQAAAVEQARAMAVKSVEALQWTSSEAGGDLVQLLRCLQQLWHQILADEQLQIAAMQALESKGLERCAESNNTSDSTSTLASIAAALSNSLLGVICTSKKRSLLMYTATISTFLLPELCVFDAKSQPDLAVLHERSSGPVRRFIQGALQQGSKGSPRLMLVLALQLATYSTLNPWLLSCYAEELRQLVMFGVGQAAGSEGDSQAFPSHQAQVEFAQQLAPLDPELQEAYALTDIGPRVAICCGLHAVAAHAGLVAAGSPDQLQANCTTDCWRQEAEAAGAAQADPQLSGDQFKVGSEAHRLRIRAWQGLASAVAFLTSTAQQQAAAEALADMLEQLTLNNPPSVKQYHEAIVATLLLSHPCLLEQQLIPLLVNVEKGNAYIGSLILVAVQTALHLPPEKQLTLLPQMLKLLLPWTNHHNHNVRTFAQLGYAALLDQYPLQEWPGWQQGLGVGGCEVAAQVLRFMLENVEFQRFRKAMGAGILAWSPEDATNPRRIFSCTVHLAGPEEVPVTFEGVPECLMDRLVNFLAAERRKLREDNIGRLQGFEGSSSAEQGTSSHGSLGVLVDFQRKVTPHERAILMADVLEEVEEVGAEAASKQQGGLIVVASLISKVPNLGGLARTAEVFGAQALVLADKRVTQQAAFTGVSVTAEHWVPIWEVKEEALLPWLANKKKEGYMLVGLEQTAESTSLPQFKFPAKTVLVLGREKEGIPPEVIMLLDATVEIPQLGLIRSLNVHVSGALAMYEFAKQRLIHQLSAREGTTI
eukprot:gene6297-6532_t